MVSEKKNLFSKYTYKDFFCENDLDNDINPFSSENDDNFEGNFGDLLIQRMLKNCSSLPRNS